MDEAVNTFIRRRKILQIETWVMRAIVAEAFLIALWPLGATLALAFGIVFWLFRLKVDPDFHFRHLPFDVPISVFVVVSGASVLVSPDMAFSFYNYYNLVGVYVLTYVLVGQNIRTRAEVKRLLAAMAGSAFLVVLYGFYQYLFGIDIGEMRWVDGEAFPELRTRVFSTWENPNILAGYLDAAICVALGIYAKVSDKPRKVILAVGMVLLALCLAMTYARGACLTIAIILVGYGILRDRRVLLACLVGAVVLLLADSTLYGRLASVFTKVDTSTEMRWAIWESTIAMIEDHPFFGIGWGAFWMVYPSYDFYLEGADVKLVHAHNIFLNYLAEIGVVGTLAFFWYFFGTMGTALRFRDEKLEDDRQALADRNDRKRRLEMRIHDTAHMVKVKKEAEEKRQADEAEKQRIAEEERRNAEIDEELAALKEKRREQEEEARREAAKLAEEKAKAEGEKDSEEAAEAKNVGPDNESQDKAEETPDEVQLKDTSEEKPKDAADDKADDESDKHEAEKEAEEESEEEVKRETEEETHTEVTAAEIETEEIEAEAEAELETKPETEPEAESEVESEVESNKTSNPAEHKVDDTVFVKKEAVPEDKGESDSKARIKESDEPETVETSEKKEEIETRVEVKPDRRRRKSHRRNRKNVSNNGKENELLSLEAKRAAIEIANMEAELKSAQDELSAIEAAEMAELSKPEPTYEEAIRNWDSHVLCEGACFGIGLAFISVILNGLTDDLLFNIPTSMLLWFLAALAVCIPEIPKDDPEREVGLSDDAPEDDLMA